MQKWVQLKTETPSAHFVVGLKRLGQLRQDRNSWLFSEANKYLFILYGRCSVDTFPVFIDSESNLKYRNGMALVWKN